MYAASMDGSIYSVHFFIFDLTDKNNLIILNFYLLAYLLQQKLILMDLHEMLN